MRAAFADESFFERPTAGFYVLATVVFDAEVAETAREVMLQLRGRRQTTKLHGNEMSTPQRLAAAKTLADLDGLHVVTVGAPVPAKRQERARAQCLTRLVVELVGYGVTDLWLEARTATLDRRDVTTVTGARHHLPRGTLFRVEHRPGGADALFWAADIVAGAVRAGRSGRGRAALRPSPLPLRGWGALVRRGDRQCHLHRTRGRRRSGVWASSAVSD